LPSTPILHAILDKIRQKCNIPEVLPENKRLVESLRAERTAEEWKAVFNDLEQEIRSEIQPLPPEFEKIVQGGAELLT
jgi:DNA-directed RNA polymerase specialized sigma24 family protein